MEKKDIFDITELDTFLNGLTTKKEIVRPREEINEDPANKQVVKIVPTIEQAKIIKEAVDFLVIGEESDCMVLIGKAGTGKTTITGFIVNELPRFLRIGIAAPTHKALSVIKKKITSTRNIKYNTVASLVGMRPDANVENYNPNNPDFKVNGSKLMSQFDVLLIDEASMIPNQPFDALLDVAEQNNVKILFIGDILQLPPIKEIVSKSFLVKNKLEATNIIRQSNTNRLKVLLSYVREDLEYEIDMAERIKRGEIDTPMYSNKWFEYMKEKPSNMIGDEGYICFDVAGFNKKLEELALSEEFKNDRLHFKYMAYTNEKVREYNQKIRETIFGKQIDFLVPGDVLMSYSTIREEDTNSIKISNSVDYEVVEVEEIEKYFTPQQIDSYGRVLNPLKEVKKEEIKSNSITLPTYKVKLRNVDSNNIVDNLYITKPDNYSIIRNEHFKFFKRDNFGFSHYTWKQQYGYYLDFRKATITIQDIYEDVNTLDIYNFNAKTNRLVTSKDFDRGYAITVHKSQGSTYNIAMVDVKNIIDYLNIRIDGFVGFNKRQPTVLDIMNLSIEHKKLLYVALSRPAQWAGLLIR